MRRNSLEEAIKLCLASGLQGIVSEVRAIFRNPSAISKIKETDPLNIFHFTYYKLVVYVWRRIDTESCSYVCSYSNVPEAVYMQAPDGGDR